MSDAIALVAGVRATKFRLTVSNQGPWYIDATLIDDTEIGGQVRVTVGDLAMLGTITQQGAFGGQRKVRIVAGGGGWSTRVPAKAYHNDAGLKAITVVQDTARLVGENIGRFVPASERVGVDYIREIGMAARVLEDIIGGIPWWVDMAGLTQVGLRPSTPLDSKDYLVLAYNPQDQLATIAADDPAKIKIGSTLVDGLDAPRVIRSYDLTIDETGLRFVCWVGGSDIQLGDLPGVLKSIVKRVTDGRLYGKYKYRVLSMSGDRVDLQVVRKGTGLPDAIPVSLWPGIAGYHPNLTKGAEVLVEFIEGDRTQPAITGFAGKDGAGFAPVGLVLGGNEGPPAARQGDAVEVLMPPAIFTGTILVNGVPSPATGVVAWALPKAIGIVTGGSGKVKIS